MDFNKDELDRKIIERLKKKIILAEGQNIRTKNKNESQMISDIKKWIEEEVKCCLNR